MWRFPEQQAAIARALVDRLAFGVESLAVALLIIVLVGLAATRFDLTGAAYVWGFFWMRIAEADAAMRAPILGLLGLVVLVATVLAGWVRWTKASRAFDAFPPSRRARLKMLERLQ